MYAYECVQKHASICIYMYIYIYIYMYIFYHISSIPFKMCKYMCIQMYMSLSLYIYIFMYINIHMYKYIYIYIYISIYTCVMLYVCYFCYIQPGSDGRPWQARIIELNPSLQSIIVVVYHMRSIPMGRQQTIQIPNQR